MDVLEELLIDFVAHVPPRVLFDQRSEWEDSIIEILAATPLHDRAHRITLMAKFLRDLDLRSGAVVAHLEQYRRVLKDMVLTKIARAAVD